jgi:hypothetical protein
MSIGFIAYALESFKEKKESCMLDVSKPRIGFACDPAPNRLLYKSLSQVSIPGKLAWPVLLYHSVHSTDVWANVLPSVRKQV